MQATLDSVSPRRPIGLGVVWIKDHAKGWLGQTFPCGAEYPPPSPPSVREKPRSWCGERRKPLKWLAFGAAQAACGDSQGRPHMGAALALGKMSHEQLRHTVSRAQIREARKMRATKGREERQERNLWKGQ